MSELTFVNGLIPKSRRKIVFYSNMGFRDNVKAVYDYLITCPGAAKYKIICAVSDWQDFASREHPKNVKFVIPSTVPPLNAATQRMVDRAKGSE